MAEPNLLPILLPRGTLSPTTEVYTWGGSGFIGALSRGKDDTESLPIKPVSSLSHRSIVDVSCGSYSTAAISEQGELFLSGLNDEGQLILSKSEDDELIDSDVIFRPREVRQLIGQRIVQAALGEKHVACVNSSWQALAFGASETGALGTTLTPNAESLSPRVIRGIGPNKIVQVACGGAHTLILTRFGMVFSSGSGLRGALGHGDLVDKVEATRIKALTAVPIAQIACGDDFSHAVSVTGELYSWGANKYGQLGRAKETDVILTPEPLQNPPEAIRFAAAGSSHSAIISHSGRLYTAGKNDKKQLGLSNQDANVEVFSLVNVAHSSSSSSLDVNGGSQSTLTEEKLDLYQVREVACGSRHTLILLVNGKVFSAGDISEGATGRSNIGVNNNSTTGKDHDLELVDELSQKGVFRIAAAGNHNAIVRITNGSAVACLPGIRPFGVMAFQNEKAFLKAISDDKLLPEPRKYLKTRALVRETFSNPSVLAGSFSLGPGAVAKFVETICSENEIERRLKRMKMTSSEAHIEEVNAKYVAITKETNNDATATMSDIDAIRSDSATSTTASESSSTLSRSTSSLSFIRVPATDLDDDDMNSDVPSSPMFPEDGYTNSLPPPPITPRHVPRTPLGLSSTVELARASEMTESPILISSDRSGLDVASLIRTYVSLVGTGSPEVVTELCDALALLVGELEAISLSRAENDLCFVRVLFAAFLAPINAQASISIVGLTYARLCALLLAISQPKRDLLVSWAINECSTEALGLYIIRALHAHISHHWKLIADANMPRQHFIMATKMLQGSSSLPTPPFNRNRMSNGFAFEWVVRVLRCFYLANRGKAERGDALPNSAFFNSDLSSMNDGLLFEDFHLWRDRDKHKRTTASPLALCGYPFVFDASAKRRIVLIEAHLMMRHEANHAMNTMMMSTFTNAGGMIPVQPFLSLTVRRTHLLSDTLRQLMGAAAIRQNELRKQIKVQFVGEEGIDQGGVTKELFSLLVREVFDIKYGLWTFNADSRTAWPHPIAGVESSSEFKLLGMIMGLAVHNGILLDAHFPLPLYKKLLGIETKGLSDLRAVNPGLAMGLQKLLDYSPAEDVENIFCLNFEATYEAFGEAESVELCPGGKEIAVTGENRERYVQLYTNWVLNLSTDKAMGEFKSGFELLLSGPTLQMLQPEELELLVTGTPHLDFRQLERVTVYDGGFSAEDPTIKNLWSVIHSFSDEYKRKLLLFVTGSAKAPIGGLSNLAFKVQRNGAADSNSLPQAATCFNVLLLPPYPTLEKLKERLETAILETEGFGMK
jgi:alpha-tubulin suppressor-like RCC1 family protein